MDLPVLSVATEPPCHTLGYDKNCRSEPDTAPHVMKILLLGMNGQVGHELKHALPTLGQLTALGRKEADLENLDCLHRALQAQAPDIIVNAAAYTAVDKAENDEAAANKVNAQAVHVLADYARTNNTLLVHYSTDYVFDGKKLDAYTEKDAANPQSAYGRSKLAGENAILQSGCHALVFRTSWVFSAHGSNFVKTIIRLAKERESLNIVIDQIGAPTSAALIADLTVRAIGAWQKSTFPEGIYHLAANGDTSWHGLAVHIVERLQRNGIALTLGTESIYPITTEAYPTPAQRPKNSRLDTHMLRTALNIEIAHWTNDIDRVVDQLISARSRHNAVSVVPGAAQRSPCP